MIGLEFCFMNEHILISIIIEWDQSDLLLIKTSESDYHFV